MPRVIPRKIPIPLFWAVGTIVLAAILAYSNSFSGPFIFDDLPSIPQNPTIRHLGDWGQVWTPPHLKGETVGDRPVVNLTLAVNYAAGGYHVWGYHAFNLLIHLLNALLLFGVARRTFLQSPLRARYGADSLSLAWLIALIWAIHPLTTEAVTFIIQRAESLMAFFYLLTVYAFIRGTEGRGSKRWLIGSVAACYFGVLCKEVIVSAPLMVFIYDRTLVAGGFLQACRRRRLFYAGLASSWILLAIHMIGTGSRAATVGVIPGLTGPAYALSQSVAIVHYLALSFRPYPLVLNYGPMGPVTVGAAIFSAFIVLLLLAATMLALRRLPNAARPWPALALLGCWFFLILAPTSSFIPMSDSVYEHRMYLSLAAVIGAAVLAVHRFLGRWSVLVCLFAVPPLIALTMERNRDYRSSVAIWSESVAQRPHNARSRTDLGLALVNEGRYAEAISQFETALQIGPEDSVIHCNLGIAFDQEGHFSEAIEQYRQALRLNPTDAESTCNLGVVLMQEGQLNAAMEQFERAAQLDPAYAQPECNLGVALTQLERIPEAIQHYERAIQLDPNNADAHSDLGAVLGGAGRLAEAIAQYREVLRINPASAEAHYNIGVALTGLGRISEAIQEYRAALQLNPRYDRARRNLMTLEAGTGSPSGN
jgi:tetratricopeptide (TPR) repeat protein